MSDFPSQSQDKFIVRFPDGMRDRIKHAAQKNGRSMNAEIVNRLERSFGELEVHHIRSISHGGDGIENLALVTSQEHRLLHLIEDLERQIEALKAEITRRPNDL